MAFKGTSGKSSSGASMSKYDVEVEERLRKLEAAVTALQSHSHDGGGGSTAVVEGQVSTALQEVGAIKDALHTAFPGRF